MLVICHSNTYFTEAGVMHEEGYVYGAPCTTPRWDNDILSIFHYLRCPLIYCTLIRNLLRNYYVIEILFYDNCSFIKMLLLKLFILVAMQSLL